MPTSLRKYRVRATFNTPDEPKSVDRVVDYLTNILDEVEIQMLARDAGLSWRGYSLKNITSFSVDVVEE